MSATAAPAPIQPLFETLIRCQTVPKSFPRVIRQPIRIAPSSGEMPTGTAPLNASYFGWRQVLDAISLRIDQRGKRPLNAYSAAYQLLAFQSIAACCVWGLAEFDPHTMIFKIQTGTVGGNLGPSLPGWETISAFNYSRDPHVPVTITMDNFHGAVAARVSALTDRLHGGRILSFFFDILLSRVGRRGTGPGKPVQHKS